MDDHTLEVLRIYGRMLERLMAGQVPGPVERERFDRVILKLERMKDERDINWKAPE